MKIFLPIVTLFNLNQTQKEATSDITLAGVEMVAGAFNEDGLFPGIICAQNPRVGGTCWKCVQSIGPCLWTGFMSDVCCQMA